MAVAHFRRPSHIAAPHQPAGVSATLSRVEVIREGRAEQFLHARPTLSSARVSWPGLVLEDYSVPACVIARHTHVENFLHVVFRGSVKYEVTTRGRILQYSANPGTTFILP